MKKKEAEDGVEGSGRSKSSSRVEGNGGSAAAASASGSNRLLRESLVWSDAVPAAGTSTYDVLQDRLEELVVFELRSNGDKRYLRLTVRALYKYVLKAITRNKKKKEKENEGGFDGGGDSIDNDNASGNLRSSMRHPLPLGHAMFGGGGGGTAAATTTTGGGSEPAPQPQPQPGDSVGAPNPPPGAAVHGRHPVVTYRERLGGFLHPRDMRRLASPFVTSNEPEIVVRRHAMLLNFDPLRAIILRDRVLVLVPEGGDVITQALEKILKGEMRDVIDSGIFDADGGGKLTTTAAGPSDAGGPLAVVDELLSEGADNIDLLGLSAHASEQSSNDDNNNNSNNNNGRGRLKMKLSWPAKNVPGGADVADTEESVDADDDDDDGGETDDDDDDSEWMELKQREWIDLPFELQALDAVLLCVCGILSEDTLEVQQAAREYINRLVSSKGTPKSQDPLAILRALKDAVREMSSRVNGFVMSVTRVLDEDEDMALMNLSRIITHPHRFIQPVPAEVLEEESDEPELILEANLQIGLSLKNALNLIDGQVDSTSDLVNRYMDDVRNRILWANVLLTVVTVCLALYVCNPPLMIGTAFCEH